jgi:hypothetical protein
VKAGDIILPFLYVSYSLTRTGSYAVRKPWQWRPLVSRDRTVQRLQ